VSGGIRRDAATEPNALRRNARRAPLAIIAAAIVFGIYALHAASIMPSTDDAAIDVDVVPVARAVAPP
jgi:multidrug resistance efflux pump